MRSDLTIPASRRLAMGMALLGLALALSSCRKPPPPQREYRLPGGVIEVPRGETFTIRLASDPSTGYEWQLQEPVPTGTILELTDSGYDEQTAEQTFTFRGAGAGAVQIPLRYVRKASPRMTPAQTRTFRVIVN